MARKYRSTARRGVLLLIVLGMLAMFAMIGLMFVLTANQQRRGAEAARRVEQVSDPPAKLARDCVAQIIRGSTPPVTIDGSVVAPNTGAAQLGNLQDRMAFGGSVIGPHSLLETMYGGSARMGKIVAPNSRINPGVTALWTVINTDRVPRNNQEGQILVIPIVSASETANGIPAIPSPLPARPFDSNVRNFTLTNTTTPPCDNNNVVSTASTIEQLNRYYSRFVGCVLTMTNGPAAGISTRIVDFNPAGNVGTPPALLRPAFQVLCVPGITLTGQNGLNQYLAAGNAIYYVVNGAPFSGLGFGYDIATATQSAAPGTNYRPLQGTIGVDKNNGNPIQRLLAFLPNHPIHRTFYTYAPSNAYSFQAPHPTYNVPGGANTDYTAPDYQHMLLAMVLPEYLANPIYPLSPTNPNPNPPVSGTNALRWNHGISVPIPSLHRAELLQYWIGRAGITSGVTTSLTGADDDRFTQLAANYPELCYSICMRPIHKFPFHPQFTGSTPTNPNGLSRFDPLWDGRFKNLDADDPSRRNPNNPICLYQWDVDNDGDGVPDSVWVDLGLPVRRTADGKTYKPLVAILCADLDGRLNLNAHGNTQQTNSASITTAPTGDTGAALPTSVIPGRGQGRGPAEINLKWAFNYAARAFNAYACYSQLLQGMQVGPNGSRVAGRYGDDPNYQNDRVAMPGPGRIGGTVPVASPLFWNRFFTYDLNYFGYSTNVTRNLDAFGTPPDLFGASALVLDRLGRPMITPGHGNGFGGTFPPNTPYELNLSTRNTGHAVYVNSTIGVAYFDDDKPFTPAEFERVLRANDTDASRLPSRLVDLTTLSVNQVSPLLGRATLEADPSNPTAASYPVISTRNEVTTESWDVPALPTSVPYDIYKNGVQAVRCGMPARHLYDLLRASFPNLTYDQFYKILPQDVLMGLKFDVNRPFGRGRYLPPHAATGSSGTNFALVDSPADEWDNPPRTNPPKLLENFPFEPATFPATPNANSRYWLQKLNTNIVGPTPTYPVSSPPAPMTYGSDGSIFFDLSNGFRINMTTPNLGANTNTDAPFPATGLQARQLYARNLYVMACLTGDIRGMVAASPTTGSGAVENAARSLAQWAINVVDFRDRDAIMTRFAYDVNFFKAVLHAADSTQPGPPTTWTAPWVDPTVANPSDAHVVWGCERPELLLTEAIGLHDRRTEDTDQEAGPLDPARGVGARKGKTTAPAGPTHDIHFDQRFRPEGSLFFELYNPWSTGDAPSPEIHHYDQTAREWGVDLWRRTPAAGAGTYQDPVWRVLIANPVATSLTTPTPALFSGILGNTNYVPPDPDDPDPAKRNRFNRSVVRSVYFVQPPRTYVDESGTATDGVVRFYSSISLTAPQFSVVRPGRCAVVGPGTNLTGDNPTYLGFRSTANEIPGFPTQGGFTQLSSTRRIVLHPSTNSDYNYSSTGNNTNPGQVAVYLDGTTNLVNLNNNMPPVAIVVDRALTTATPQPAGNGVPRLSLTEPAVGYPPANAETVATRPARYADNAIRDRPADYEFNNTAETGSTSTGWSVVQNNQDTYCYRILYLQRLADPTRQYDVHTNPYRTVDSIQVDLSAFNGLTALRNINGTIGDRDVNVTPAIGTQPILSRQRGVRSTTMVGNSVIWAHELEDNTRLIGTTPTPTVGTNHIMARPFRCSLGITNDRFTPQNGSGNYKGVPQVPYPWLTWNNRPFISPLEMLLVPAVSSSQLLFEYRLTTTASTLYTPPAPGTRPVLTSGPFVHLKNFFQSAAYDAHTAPQMYRLLEYLGVPSPFVGTATELSPFNATNTTNDYRSDRSWVHHFHPPFNWVSNYREPGRINLNTVYSRNVWNGLMNGFPDSSNTSTSWEVTVAASGTQPTVGQRMWAYFLKSRRGCYDNLNAFPFYNGNNALTGTALTGADLARSELDALLNFHRDSTTGIVYPTRFENPFRSYAGAYLVPPTPDATATGDLLRKSIVGSAAPYYGDVNATLLRADTDPTATVRRPLFSVNSTNYQASTNNDSHPLNSLRNPYFKYQGIQRLSNLTTTRSNVYAVWITIGYFEVFPYARSTMYTSNAGAAANPSTGKIGYNLWKKYHPDDWELGQELGYDTGEIKRHRAFYLIDRTLPAGFIRGQDLNFDKTILLERFME